MSTLTRRLALVKSTWAWWFVLLALAIATTVIVLPSGKPLGISVREVLRTNEAHGQAHVSFEFTNETRTPLEFMITGFEVHHERTGWWPVYGRSVWRLQSTAGQVQSNGLLAE